MKRYIAITAFFAVLLLNLQAYAAPVEAAENFFEMRAAPAVFDLGDKTANRIYINWEQIPKKWELITYDLNGNETVYQCGEYGFLQEYVELEPPASIFEIKPRTGSPMMLSVYAFEEGEADDWVHKWQPPCDDADLLVVTARMGDEFLYYGGAIPYYIEQGKKVQVAYMTHPDGEDAHDTMHDMLDALYNAGVRNYPVIADFIDMSVAELNDAAALYDSNSLIGYNIELIRRFKPEVIVGQGDYGDGLQKLCFESLTIADVYSIDGDEFPESVEKYGVHAASKVYLHGYSNPTVMDWGDSLDVARESFAKYRNRLNRSLEIEGKYDCRRFGLFTTLVGPDTNTANPDFFENIAEDGPEPETGGETEDIEENAVADGNKEHPVPTVPAGAAGTIFTETIKSLKNIGPVGTLCISAIVCLIGAALMRMRKD